MCWMAQDRRHGAVDARSQCILYCKPKRLDEVSQKISNINFTVIDIDFMSFDLYIWIGYLTFIL